MNWSTLLYAHSWKQNSLLVESNLKEIVEIQSILLTAIILAKNNKQVTKALNLVRIYFFFEITIEIN